MTALADRILFAAIKTSIAFTLQALCGFLLTRITGSAVLFSAVTRATVAAPN